MVHTLAINPSPLFQIRLEQDLLTMHGSQTESAGCFLRGQLVLVLTESIKVREIRLTFKGKSKVSWTDGAGSGQYHHSERRIIFQHDWVFLPAEKNYHVLKPDNYHWEFELALPGTLPETINVCEKNNYIKYTLKAVAERHTFASNLKTRRQIEIQRCLLPSSLDLIQSTVISNVWANRVEYELGVESKVFSLGDKIPITVRLKPLRESLVLSAIICVLKEYITNHIGVSTKTESRIIKVFRDVDAMKSVKVTDGEDGSTVWTRCFNLLIPDSKGRCLVDSDNDFIKIKHKLKFWLVFQNPKERSLSELRAVIPIIITRVSPNSEMMFLPAYDSSSENVDDNNNNNNCDDSIHNAASIINSENYDNLSSSSSLSIPNDNNDNNLSTSPISIPYNITDVNSNSSFVDTSSEGSPEIIHHHTINHSFDQEISNRLPSYKSITNEIPAPLIDSILPPVYDDSFRF